MCTGVVSLVDSDILVRTCQYILYVPSRCPERGEEEEYLVADPVAVEGLVRR